MATTYTNNENGAEAANPSDRTVLVTITLSPVYFMSVAQIVALYHAMTGRTVHEDVMLATLRDGERRNMVERDERGRWRIAPSYCDSFQRTALKAIADAA